MRSRAIEKKLTLQLENDTFRVNWFVEWHELISNNNCTYYSGLNKTANNEKDTYTITVTGHSDLAKKKI